MSSQATAAMAYEAPGLPKTVRLHENERVVTTVLPSHWWTLGRYIFTLGLWYFWRKRHVYVLTNERVIAVKGIINTREASAPLSRIQDLHLKRSIFTGGTVAWSTAGGGLGVTQIKNVTRADAARIADAMTPLIGREHSGA
jgi:uncharacterized membrane protein YdbT with pleckstrin-like domain